MTMRQTIGHSTSVAGQSERGHVSVSSEITRYLERSDGCIAYDDSGGSGALVIAIPGMGDLRAQYRFLRPNLICAGYRVVTMDVRGQGESSTNWNDYSAKAVAEDALALIEHLGVAKAFIIGNSFAAGAGLWAAHSRPDTITGVAMIGPILRDLPVSSFIKGIVRLGFAGPWRIRFWTAYWNSLFPINKPSDHTAYRERLERSLREPGRMDALQTMVWLSKADTESIVCNVSVPTLVIMGSHDPDFNDPIAETVWISENTGGQVAIVQGAGHYPHVELPDQVAGELQTFLDRLKGK